MNNPPDLDRILAEQCAARDLILSGNGTDNTWLWLEDWVAEEILATQPVRANPRRKPDVR